MKYLYLKILFFLLISISAHAVELVNEQFTSNINGWSVSDSSKVYHSSSNSGSMFIDANDRAWKTYSFGASYSNQTLDIEVQWCATNPWESDNDYLRVRINDNTVESDYDGGGCQDTSFTATADINGDFKIEFSPRVSADNEDAYIEWFTVNGTPTVTGCDNSLDTSANDNDPGQIITGMHNISTDTTDCISGSSPDDDEEYYYFTVNSAGTLDITSSTLSSSSYYLKVGSSSDGNEHYGETRAENHTVPQINLASGDSVYIYIKESGSSGDDWQVDLSFIAAASTDLSITSLTDSTDPAAVDTDITYTVSLENNGNEATNVDLNLTATSGVFKTAPAGWTCTGVGTDDIKCNYDSTLSDGQTRDVDFIFTTPSTDQEITISAVTGSDTIDSDTLNNTATETTRVGNPLNFTCANPREFTRTFIENTTGDIDIIGNTVLCQNDGNGACTDPGNNRNNNIDMININTDIDPNTFNHSSAELGIPADSIVIKAILYWQGVLFGNNINSTTQANAKSVLLKVPNGTYQTITSEDEKFNWIYLKENANRWYYQGARDITNELNVADANGSYSVANILTQEGRPAGGSYGAWSIVLIYSNNDMPTRNLTIFDGYQGIMPGGGTSADCSGRTSDPLKACQYAEDNGCSLALEDTGVANPISIGLSGFLTSKTGDVNASLALFTGEGDKGASGDKLSITDKSDTAHFLSDGENPENDVQNATISKKGNQVLTLEPQSTLAGGTPWPNSLGADVDLYDITGVLSNSQNSTEVTMNTSGDGYFPGVFAFATDLRIIDLCYDYTYGQDGIFLTATDITDPRIEGTFDTSKPLDVKLYFANLENSDVTIENLQVHIDPINTSEAIYQRNSTYVARPNQSRVAFSDVNVGDSYDKNISIGDVGSLERFYTYYSLEPTNRDVDLPLNATLTYNLTVTIDGQSINLGESTSSIHEMSACQQTPTYNPTPGMFNIVHPSQQDNTLSSGYFYNLPTQVVSRTGNFLAQSLDPDNLDTLKGAATVVAVEMLDAGGFYYSTATCTDENATITSTQRVWTVFETNATSIVSLNKTDLTNANFFTTPLQNAAFRISYNVTDANGSIVELDPTTKTIQPGNNVVPAYNVLNFTEAKDYNGGRCLQDMDGNLNSTDTIAQYCSNAGKSNASAMTKDELDICMECVYGINTKRICSRDNFSIRPEAFSLSLSDHNQTNTSQTRFLLNNTDVINTVDLAAGYDYTMDVNATDHLNNPITTRYTTSLVDTNLTWIPNVGCNDDSNDSINIGFANGAAKTILSRDQVGRYTLSMLDSKWTGVDHVEDYMLHHTGTYFKANTIPDCNIASGSDDIVHDENQTLYNGCYIRSNHENTVHAETYQNIDVAFHPYKFNMTGVTATLGFTNAALGANSFIYMADISQATDENMSMHLNGVIEAQGYNNSSLNNFVSGCYARGVDLNISKDDTTLLNSTGGTVMLQSRFHNRALNTQIITAQDINTNDATPLTDLSIPLTSAYFITDMNGSINTILNINYNREKNSTVNPKRVQYSDYKVNCTDEINNCRFNADLRSDKTTEGVLNINNGLTHYYGRTNAPTKRYIYPVGTAGNPAQDPIYYDVFCYGSSCDKTLLQASSINTDDPRWFINTQHTSDFGIPGTVTQKNASNVTVSVGTEPTGNHPDSVGLVYDGLKGYPYIATMENNASSWLIYDKYKPVGTNNENEFDVEFLNSGEWTGKKETSSTTNNNSSVVTNRRTNW